MGNEHWIAGAVEALAGGATGTSKTNRDTPRQKTGRAIREAKPSPRAPSQPNERVSMSAKPNGPPPAQPDCRGHITRDAQARLAPANQTEAAKAGPDTIFGSPPRPDSAAPKLDRNPDENRAAETELAGQLRYETHSMFASQPHSGGRSISATQLKPAPGTQIVDGHLHHETQGHVAIDDPIIGSIVENWRRRQDMVRARVRLELQAQAICRRSVDGDKTQAAKLWAQVRKDTAHPLRDWLNPFIMAIEPLMSSQRDIEKVLARMVKELPVYEWASGIRGFGEVGLAGIIGECGIGPGEYRSVSALWKRMEMAVINGGRQRRVTGADALVHNYGGARRSHMWVVGAALIQAQLRSVKDENGKKIEGSEYSLGELVQVYLDRKAYLREKNEAGGFAARAEQLVADAKRRGGKPNQHNLDGKLSPIHIANDAKRFMEKRLLRQLWQEWRRAAVTLKPTAAAPAADMQEAA